MKAFADQSLQLETVGQIPREIYKQVCFFLKEKNEGIKFHFIRKSIGHVQFQRKALKLCNY